ncbi:MAG TPA: adenylate/guanylate cyclase domain-containing protein [Pyrinomonadaceae bacterium]|jgi:class 3 adenylate cyclase
MSNPRTTLREWAGASTAQVALVFTDIVDSTALANEMGDKKWIEALIQHLSQARRALVNYDCYEIKFIGDSFMVAFRTTFEALLFALALFANTGHPKVKIRAGIHVGEVHIIENDMFGGMVNYAARVLKAAADNEEWIVVSDYAKTQIVQAIGSKNSDLLFSELKVKLKGFDDPYKHKVWVVETRKMRRAADAKRRRSWEKTRKDLSELLSDLSILMDGAMQKRNK